MHIVKESQEKVAIEIALAKMKLRLPFRFKLSRVHKKQIAGEGFTHLIVETKKGKMTYTAFIKIPTHFNEEQVMESASEIYKGLVKRYNLAEL